MSNGIHVGACRSCDVRFTQQRADELSAHSCSTGENWQHSGSRWWEPFNESNKKPCHHRAWPTPLRASEGHGPKRLQADCDWRTENDSTQRAGQAAQQLEVLHARSLRGWDTSTRHMRLESWFSGSRRERSERALSMEYGTLMNMELSQKVAVDPESLNVKSRRRDLEHWAKGDTLWGKEKGNLMRSNLKRCILHEGRDHSHENHVADRGFLFEASLNIRYTRPCRSSKPWKIRRQRLQGREEWTKSDCKKIGRKYPSGTVFISIDKSPLPISIQDQLEHRAFLFF